MASRSTWRCFGRESSWRTWIDTPASSRSGPCWPAWCVSCAPFARIGGAIVAEERETARLQDMLRHEVAEIERAELRDGEDDDLRARQSRLEHVEKLRTAASLAHQALSGVDADDQAGAIDLLGQAIAACSDGSRFDAALGTEAESLNAALMQAEESARALREYVDSLEADPDALERATERLFLIGDLKRKFG